LSNCENPARVSDPSIFRDFQSKADAAPGVAVEIVQCGPCSAPLRIPYSSVSPCACRASRPAYGRNFLHRTCKARWMVIFAARRGLRRTACARNFAAPPGPRPCPCSNNRCAFEVAFLVQQCRPPGLVTCAWRVFFVLLLLCSIVLDPRSVLLLVFGCN